MQRTVWENDCLKRAEFVVDNLSNDDIFFIAADEQKDFPAVQENLLKQPKNSFIIENKRLTKQNYFDGFGLLVRGLFDFLFGSFFGPLFNRIDSKNRF